MLILSPVHPERHQSAGLRGRAHHSQMQRTAVSSPRPTGRIEQENQSYARPVLRLPPLHSDLKNQAFSFVHGVQWPDLSPSKGEGLKARKKLQNESSIILPTQQPCQAIAFQLCLCKIAATRSQQATIPPHTFFLRFRPAASERGSACPCRGREGDRTRTTSA